MLINIPVYNSLNEKNKQTKKPKKTQLYPIKCHHMDMVF